MSKRFRSASSMPIVLGIVALICIVVGCEQPADPDSGSKNVILAPNTILLDSAMRSTHLVRFDTGAVTVRAGDTSVKPGRFIVSDSGTGSIRRVVSVHDSSGFHVATTEPACITEVIERGRIAFRRPLASLMARQTMPVTSAAAGKMSMMSDGSRIEISMTDVPVYESQGDTVFGDATVTLDEDLDFELDIDGFEIRTARCVLRGTQSVTLALRSQALSRGFRKEWSLLKEPLKLPSFTVMVGWLPVVLTPQLEFFAGVEGDVAPGFAMSVHGTSAHALGPQKQGGEWDLVQEHNEDLKIDEPDFEYTGDIRFDVSARLGMMVYGVTGPFVNVALFGELAGTAYPEFSLTAYAGVEVRGGWSAQFCGANFGEFQSPPLDIKTQLWTTVKRRQPQWIAVDPIAPGRKPGEKIDYAVMLTDDSRKGVPNERLKVQVPQGWTSNAIDLTTGTTGGAAWNVTVPVTAAPGVYDISVRALDHPMSATSHVTVTTVSPPVATMLMVTPDEQKIVAPPGMVQYSATVKDRDGRPFTGATMTTNLQPPLTAAPAAGTTGTSGSLPFAVTVPASTPDGTYTVTFSVTGTAFIQRRTILVRRPTAPAPNVRLALEPANPRCDVPRSIRFGVTATDTGRTLTLSGRSIVVDVPASLRSSPQRMTTGNDGTAFFTVDVDGTVPDADYPITVTDEASGVRASVTLQVRLHEQGTGIEMVLIMRVPDTLPKWLGWGIRIATRFNDRDGTPAHGVEIRVTDERQPAYSTTLRSDSTGMIEYIFNDHVDAYLGTHRLTFTASLAGYTSPPPMGITITVVPP